MLRKEEEERIRLEANEGETDLSNIQVCGEGQEQEVGIAESGPTATPGAGGKNDPVPKEGAEVEATRQGLVEGSTEGVASEVTSDKSTSHPKSPQKCVDQGINNCDVCAVTPAKPTSLLDSPPECVGGAGPEAAGAAVRKVNDQSTDGPTAPVKEKHATEPTSQGAHGENGETAEQSDNVFTASDLCGPPKQGRLIVTGSTGVLTIVSDEGERIGPLVFQKSPTKAAKVGGETGLGGENKNEEIDLINATPQVLVHGKNTPERNSFNDGIGVATRHPLPTSKQKQSNENRDAPISEASAQGSADGSSSACTSTNVRDEQTSMPLLIRSDSKLVSLPCRETGKCMLNAQITDPLGGRTGGEPRVKDIEDIVEEIFETGNTERAKKDVVVVRDILLSMVDKSLAGKRGVVGAPMGTAVLSPPPSGNTYLPAVGQCSERERVVTHLQN